MIDPPKTNGGTIRPIIWAPESLLSQASRVGTQVALDKVEGLVKREFSEAVRQHRSLARTIDDRIHWRTRVNQFVLNQPPSTNHRCGHFCGHDSAMRTSRLYGRRERPINITV